MDLTEALQLRPRDVVALVGGGGKTTTMYRLCREAAARGRLSVASGTARFTPPIGRRSPPPLLVDEDEARLLLAVREALKTNEWLIAASGRGSKQRLQPLSYEAVTAIAALPEVGLLALEADGSAMRSFKAPAAHEPALPPAATFVVAVVGADIFGRPLNADNVHRPERVMELSGATLGDVITTELVAKVLAHREGGRKGVPATARWAVLINKVSAARLEPARETARLLLAQGAPLVVLARVREEPPVVEVLGT